MTSQLPNNDDSSHNSVTQTANAGGKVFQAGRDYNHSSNVNIWASFFLFGVLAFGGLAWAFNVGNIQNGGNPQQQSPQPAATATATPSQ